MHEIDAYVSFPRESKLEVFSPESRTIPCTAFAQIRSTGDAGIEGDLVYAGQGGLDDYKGLDVKGKIVLVELSYTPPRPEKLRIATIKGAAGLIMMNWGLPEHDSLPLGTVKAIWGNPTDEDFHLMPTLPAVGITRADGEKLRDLSKQRNCTGPADREGRPELGDHPSSPYHHPREAGLRKNLSWWAGITMRGEGASPATPWGARSSWSSPGSCGPTAGSSTTTSGWPSGPGTRPASWRDLPGSWTASGKSFPGIASFISTWIRRA